MFMKCFWYWKRQFFSLAQAVARRSESAVLPPLMAAAMTARPARLVLRCPVVWGHPMDISVRMHECTMAGKDTYHVL